MIAKASIHWILTPFIAFLIFLFLGIYINKFFFILGFLFLIISVFFLFFYRNPHRVPKKNSGMVAPADGKILPFRDDNKIRIFMNIQDVHVNRAPLDGKVLKQNYRKGGYKPAFTKDSDRNERLEWIIETKNERIELAQIAGALVRRIVPYKKVNDSIKRGEEIGMIRFGSRVDVSIPKSYKILVSERDKVYAGETIIAEKR